MDLQDAGATVTHLIRDRDSKYTRAFDAVFEAEGIEVVTTGIREPRMNSIMERRVQTLPTQACRRPPGGRSVAVSGALARVAAPYSPGLHQQEESDQRNHRAQHGVLAVAGHARAAHRTRALRDPDRAEDDEDNPADTTDQHIRSILRTGTTVAVPRASIIQLGPIRCARGGRNSYES
ncbi:hypothetical protein [Streptomyces sp. NPDC002619]|uniref:hypothetical protein n=1 Tax=Streptomyces sp. NPDC002619 TaxID=3364655 RepID=UPI0036AFA249